MTPELNTPPTPPDLQALSELAPELASTFVSVAADIALVIDANGVIQHVAMGADPIVGSTGRWLGQPWVDTVTGGTRRKIELLLSEVNASGIARRREVNLPGNETSDIPVAYSAIRLGRNGPVLAVGRDLRAVAAIQQRFVEATQTMERDYWSQRQAEFHVRTLYQLATDGVLLVDAHTLKVVDCNQAARTLLLGEVSESLGQSLVGREAAMGVLPAERPGFVELLAKARTSGRPGVMRAHAASVPVPSGEPPLAPAALEVSATPLRSGPSMQLMVQLRSIEAEADPAMASRRRAAWVDSELDALVVTDSSGRVLMCNPAFVGMCQSADGASVQRRTLVDLVGDPSFTVARLLQQARSHGLAKVAQAFLGLDSPFAAELTATLQTEGDQECIGLRLRRLQPKSEVAAAAGKLDPLALACARLADQMGVVAVPQLLQQAAAVAERHLITEALARCQGRMPEAGSLLGIPESTLQERMQHLGLNGSDHAAAGLTQDTTP